MKDGSQTPASKDFINPNRMENLELKSPNAEPRDVFSTTNLGYANSFKSTKLDYKKKLQDEKQHRLRMRKVILG
jgi:hypothetical protein